MVNFRRYIDTTKKILAGEGSWEDLVIPPDYAGEVARGTAILDVYTNFAIFQNEEFNDIIFYIPSIDDGYSALDMYVYGAIQLAEDFGTEDFYNYYSLWVDEVIIPALREIRDEYHQKNNSFIDIL